MTEKISWILLLSAQVISYSFFTALQGKLSIFLIIFCNVIQYPLAVLLISYLVRGPFNNLTGVRKKRLIVYSVLAAGLGFLIEYAIWVLANVQLVFFLIFSIVLIWSGVRLVFKINLQPTN